jgi:hypothetical protein
MAAITVARLEAILSAKTRDFDRALDKSDKKMSGLAKVALGSGLAIGATLGVGLKKAADAAIEAEKAQARLNQALAGAGISQDKYGASIQANIEKTSRLAALDDEDLSDSFAKLVRSTGDVTKATEGMNLAADIARSRNISLEAATKAVERSMIGNAAAFSRLGVQVVKSSDNLLAAKQVVEGWRDSSGKLTEAENQKAKALFDSAKELDKQATAAAAFDAAQRKFSGGAEEYGKTTAAAQERLGVAFENLQEKIGAKLLPVLAKLAEFMLKVLDATEKYWPRIQAAVLPTLERIGAAIKKFVEDVQRIWDQWGEEIMAVAAFVFNSIRQAIENTLRIIGGIVDVFMGIFTGDWDRAWGGIKDIVGGVFDAIKLLLTTAITVWGELGKRIGSALKEAVIDGVTGLASAVWGLITRIGDLIADGAGTIKGWGADVGGWVKQGVIDGITGIGAAAWGMVNNIWERIEERAGQVKGWGKSIGEWVKDAVVDGLDGIGNAIWNAIKSGWDWAVGKLKGLPGIGSLIGGPGEGGAGLPPSRGGAGTVAGVGLSPNIIDELALGQSMGLYMSSGLRPPRFPGDDSDHIYGRAIDMVGSAQQMASFAVAAMTRPGVKDVFYDPLGYSLDNGKFWGATIGGHTDHVHVSTFDKGGWLKPGLTLAYNGTGAPERVGGRGDIHLHFHGDMYGQPPRQFFKQVRDGLRELDLLQTGGRVLNATPTLS